MADGSGGDARSHPSVLGGASNERWALLGPGASPERGAVSGGPALEDVYAASGVVPTGYFSENPMLAGDPTPIVGEDGGTGDGRRQRPRVG